MVGTGIPDDAGVYRLRPDLALVQTVDFFTPVVDDPYWFGQVAAANALSDIYAMGATPLTALNLVAFPSCKLGPEVLRAILKGGCDKVAEAGALVLGGHSVEDDEPKYGLAVTGVVHPAEVVTNSGACPGDFLILTKPLGTGVMVTALKGGLLTPDEERKLAEVMALLNAPAAEAMRLVGVHACTDITGFGLLGHLREMAVNSGVDVEIELASLPLLPKAKKFAEEGLIPGGAYRNKEYLKDHVEIGGRISPAEEDLLYDPQTSGGLLIAVSGEKREQLLSALREKGVASPRAVGRVTGRGKGRILVRGV
ncbi:selenide, water dikinase SelD [Thermacetogenium phaeum DSM 12270]|uniref:Selenide, water dikinase n=1 Tax=Thermacetogenium phaeum (strain ATCC BAA-254 / DSM 26808 / PB) TaxID=1089553 RepID=K4LBQ9_THEPS|nr:selenide, water dikinase SelD [Thermacetogenium phaeum DSM 12270]